MSLDAEISKLTKHGGITIQRLSNGETEIIVADFEGDNCTCRDVAVQACLWAIGELQRELLKNIERPGGSGCTYIE